MQEAVEGAESESRASVLAVSDFRPLLEVENLTVCFETSAGLVRAVEGVSLTLDERETVALVGESGCGKTVTALALARLLPSGPSVRIEGRIRFRGEEVLAMSASRLRRLRGAQIAYVFQEPATALNPVLRVGAQIEEGIRRHRPGEDTRAEALRLLTSVGLPSCESLLRAYPHELSGGMRQRVLLATALACRPELLVADEPTTALDVTVQAQILDVLQSLQRSSGMAVLLITHNVALVARLARRVYVLYAGRLLEAGPTRAVIRNPWHPYTAALVASVPRLRGAAADLRGIPGTVPSPTARIQGCAFAPRCPRCQPDCLSEAVPWRVEPAAPQGCSEAGRSLRGVRCRFPLSGPLAGPRRVPEEDAP